MQGGSEKDVSLAVVEAPPVASVIDEGLHGALHGAEWPNPDLGFLSPDAARVP